MIVDLLRLHASLAEQRERQKAVTEQFVRAHPGVPIATIANRPTDVHDLDDLRLIGEAAAAAAAFEAPGL